MELAIDANGIRKRYGKVHALRDVDLQVPGGAIFGLLGENGAGKTTFIKVLLDVVRADGGEVRVLGLPPGSIEARRHIGYLPENLQLPAALSAVGFLRSAGRLKGLSGDELRDQIPRLLGAVGLDGSWWNKRTSTYSKGMRQRTGLAGALLGRPRLLVLDEPTDGIDPLGRAELREVIRGAARDGATVFLNSHLLAETEKIADHAAILSKGRVVLSGRLDILRADDRFGLRFRAGEGVRYHLEGLGFQVLEEDDGTQESPGDTIRCVFAGQGARALSSALRDALGAGLVVTELKPMVKDLESVMADAVMADAVLADAAEDADGEPGGDDA